MTSGPGAPPCPVCAQNMPRHLPVSSDGASVNYYRCDRCRHIWTTSKVTGNVLTHVTPLPSPSRTAPKN